MSRQRLQKYLAHVGIGSRRTCERYILEGRIQVNGQTASIGISIDPQKDLVVFEGRPVEKPTRPVYIALHKPRGVVSSIKTYRGERGLMDLVEINERIYPAGRLDKDSEGLMLLTNDGDLTYRLTHPRFQHEREYRVKVQGVLTEVEIKRWQEGVFLEQDGKTAPAEVWIINTEGSSSWLGIVMHEGRKRQIRRVAAEFNLQVRRIIRIRIGTLKLGNLASSSWRYLHQEEVERLKKSVI